MLTAFDAELYPDDCEVVEILPHNRWVYLIQKNGSSSLRKDAINGHYRIYRNQEIEDLDYVDVYVRDFDSRYVSGVNTFVQHLLRDDRTLDRDTCLTLATRYLFMNRHYLPQFHWVLNLSRFLSPTCQIRFHSFDDIRNITDRNDDAGIVAVSDLERARIIDGSKDIRLWRFLDQVLEDHIGKSIAWSDLLEYYKAHPSGIYDILTAKFQIINQTLDVLS